MGKENVIKTKSRNKNLNVFVIIFLVVLLVYSISLIIPLIWGFYTSFKHTMDFRTNKVGLPDFSFWSKYDDPGYNHIFANYTIILENFSLRFSSSYYVGIFTQTKVTHDVTAGIWTCLYNTILYCAGCTILPTFMSLLVGYLCAKYRYKFSTLVYGFVVFTMVMPIVGTMPAMITLLRQIGFYDEFYGHWIRQCAFGGTSFLIFYGFYTGLSNTYIEAAEIDGASQLRILFAIIIPLAKTTCTTLMLLAFIAAWNDYNTPLFYLPTKPTLSYGIFYLTQRGATRLQKVPMIVASLMLLAIPVLVIFITLRNKLMGNISLGGIKE